MKKPRKLETRYGLVFEVWKDDGDYEYIHWDSPVSLQGLIKLSEAKRLRAMCDYVIKKSEEPKG